MAVALLGSVQSSNARADTAAPKVEVTWRGPNDCARERFVDGLAHHLSASDAGPVAIAVDVTSEATTWRLRATLVADGKTFATREFSARSCEAVCDAAALATAIAVDPMHVVEPPAVAPSDPEPEPVPVRVFVPDLDLDLDLDLALALAPDLSATIAEPEPIDGPTPPTHRTRAPRLTHATLGIAALLDGGALPGVGAGPSASLGLLRRHLRIDLIGTWRAPVVVRAPAERNQGARIDLFTIGARVCGVVNPARTIELPLCAGVDAGLLRGRGFGLAKDRTARLLWSAAVASSGVTWVFHRHLAISLRTEVGVPLARHEFAVAGHDAFDAVAPVFGRGLLGLEVRS